LSPIILLPNVDSNWIYKTSQILPQ